MNALIFADNKYQENRMGILRAPGAHRIATLLRSHNIDTEVIDFYLDWTQTELKQLIDSLVTQKTLFVGFSCSLMFDGISNFEFIRDYIKSKNTNTAIVVGGFHTTQKGFEGADWYVEGYGEGAVIALTEYLLGNSLEVKYELDEHNQKVIYTKDHYPVNKLQSMVTTYIPSDFIHRSEVLSMETARGCIFKCKFCSFQLLGKSKVDYLRDAEEIRTEFLTNYRLYGTTKYIITEDTFNDTDEKVSMLSDIVKSLPFKPEFMGYVRADLLVAKPHNLKKLIECGFTNMHFGIETFNEDASKIISKGMSSNKLKEALIKFKTDYPQIYTNGTFIVGLPGESAAEIRETAQWIIDSKALDFWTFNPLMIPKQHKLIYNSEFTNNYIMYGYSKMTTEEIDNATNKNEKLLFGTKMMPYMILWKNKNFDYFSAAMLAVEINQQANAFKKVDAWSSFAMSSLGMDLKEIQKCTYSGNNPLDQEHIVDETKYFVDTYKRRKLKFLTKNVDINV